VDLQCLQIREGVHVAELTGVDQAHVDVADLGPLEGLEEERIGAANMAADLEGCESPCRQLLGFGRLAYPLHGAGNQP
jgi:hypothetical protein